MIIEDPEVSPLLAQVNSDIRAGDGQIGTALIEAKVLDFIAFLELNGLEVLEFTQIPDPDAGVFSGRSKVVAVLGERQSRNGAAVAFEVCHVLLLKIIEKLLKQSFL